MKKVVLLLLLCFLVGCLHARHKGLYDESHFGREFTTLQKDVGEKDGSVLLEEAYPSLTRRFYGAAPASRVGGEYGSPFGMDHESDHESVVGDHAESFGDTESFSSMNEHGVSPYMSSGHEHYASHTPYSDHGVVISDSVAKKIGLYDKDYLKKLGLDNKDVVENTGSGEDDIPKEDARSAHKRPSHKTKNHHHESEEAATGSKRHRATELLLDVVNADIAHSAAHHNEKNKNTMEAIKRAMQEYAGATS
jgi:hypothetical protein